ncbi:protein chain initiation factor IF-1 [Candidatus Nasuia deltocephalinicola str. NAS-ALF]|uniref:Protein chain initiation factor IF-1 n=2 Tax=Candidatus Nasuia deltocephalincola TaxID=1160784 RepID=A0A7G6UHL1_9PROT|nr:protein chain initiation factor IF-1 [Candidatus Nasuia deltocephalinicola str. NAS-ALF]QND78508.1 Protein chain initiation factor IF-1 [Candidatus Nasuia deltocephalinicola]
MFKKKNKNLINNKKRIITNEAKVFECLPDSVYKVILKNSINPILGYLSGNMVRNHIKLIKDDIVIVELSLTDKNRCRIVFRK